MLYRSLSMLRGEKLNYAHADSFDRAHHLKISKIIVDQDRLNTINVKCNI